MIFARTVCLALLVGVSLTLTASAAELDRAPLSEVKKNIDQEKAVLVDVREQSEWKAGHIEGAIFLPLSNLQQGVSDAILEKKLPEDKTLYVHCVRGKRAVTAANILERLGYTVRPIEPGYKEMISAGFPKAKE